MMSLCGSINLECETTFDTMRTVFLELNELRRSEILCDVRIVVGDKIFPCHRVILSSSCEYFKTIFRSMSAEESKLEMVVELPNVPSDIFEQLLDFIYTGKVRVTNENLSSLLIGCEYLGLHYLENLCTLYLEEHIPLNKIGSLFLFALRTKKAGLIDTLGRCIAMNFLDLSKSDQLIDVSADGLTRILTCPDLRSTSQITTRFLLRWMDARKDKEPTESPSVTYLLKMITGSSRVQEFIQEPKKNSKLANVLRSNETLLRFLTIEYKKKSQFFLSKEKKKVYHYRSGMHEIKPLIKMMGGFEGLYPILPDDVSRVGVRSMVLDTDIMYLFYSVNDKMYPFLWAKGLAMTGEKLNEPPPNMALNTSEGELPPLALVQHKIYFNRPGKDFIFYDCDRNSWFSRATENMIHVRRSRLVSWGDNIYVIGGSRSAESCTAEVDSGGLLQQLDPRTGIINRLPNSIYEHTVPAACVYNDRIYVTGGADVSYYNKVVEVFEPVANKWRVLAPMPMSKMEHTLIPYKNHLYAVGGVSKRSTTENMISYLSYDGNTSVYDVETDTWLETISMPTKLTDGYKILGILDAVVF